MSSGFRWTGAGAGGTSGAGAGASGAGGSTTGVSGVGGTTTGSGVFYCHRAQEACLLETLAVGRRQIGVTIAPSGLISISDIVMWAVLFRGFGN